MRRPKLKLDNLVTLMTVAAKHNVDDAADELGLSASGVRKQLDVIENTFGIRLFEKIGGRLMLTRDGEQFYEDAMRGVEQIVHAEEQVYARQATRTAWPCPAASVTSDTRGYRWRRSGRGSRPPWCTSVPVGRIPGRPRRNLWHRRRQTAHAPQGYIDRQTVQQLPRGI